MATVLSEIHIDSVNTARDTETFVSRFIFTGKRTKYVGESYEVDGDGDLVLPRSERLIIELEHSMSTLLCDVGQQVWRGALLMVDFMLGHKEIFQDEVILELGGGVGLCTIVASQMSRLVFCTDYKTSILDICQKNVRRYYQQQSSRRSGNVAIKLLDWTCPFRKESLEVLSDYQWSPNDRDKLSSTAIIIASDVIYDDHLTDAFFMCLVQLYYDVVKENCVVYIALEKRVAFTLEELAPAVPAYKYFKSCLGKKFCFCMKSFSFEAALVSTNNLPQCSSYKRVKEMEIWKLTIK